MRIIGGLKRGMRLFGPGGDVSRPYSDRVKESLFSVLYKYGLIEGRVVADVFSGVGSMGLEALSRGAKGVVFVERDGKVLEVLKRNIAKAGFGEVSRVVRGDAFAIGVPVGLDGEKYGVVFVDPPYKLSREAGVGSAVAGMLGVIAGQVADDGVVVLRTEKWVDVPERYGELEVIERRFWGRMSVVIMRLFRDDE